MGGVWFFAPAGGAAWALKLPAPCLEPEAPSLFSFAIAADLAPNKLPYGLGVTNPLQSHIEHRPRRGERWDGGAMCVAEEEEKMEGLRRWVDTKINTSGLVGRGLCVVG
ncbi:hypothetical protein E2562_015178 [Oryza meyeriana var. granulata]|uniref:Uncharacterized protein n=1 Tax=Oryza meyeriana var. granulata TaxID=110450 RepID=A0A6G1EWN4_9ORYZ|nr:hypothetical protein E2562_015178 [Oryza meyeriana var. granulata]